MYLGQVMYHIYEKFKSDEKFYLEKYNKGSDEFYYKEIDFRTYDKICPSIKNYIYEKPDNYSVITLGQMHHILEKVGMVGILITY